MRADESEGARRCETIADRASAPPTLTTRQFRETPEVGPLAAAALSLLAARMPQSPDAKFGLRIEEFCDALVHADDSRARALAARLIAYGVSTDELFERYAPAAARRLGERWVEDTLGFSEVTIGAARLQELVRSLEGRFVSGGGAIPLGHSVLMAVPSFEQHSLGAFVAAGQLRRHGVWVHMGLGMDSEELARLAASQRFTAIGLSAASRRSLDPLRKLVDKLRSSGDFAGPIAIGGSVTKLGSEVKTFTGADIVTKNPREFAECCGSPKPDGVLDCSHALLGN